MDIKQAVMDTTVKPEPKVEELAKNTINTHIEKGTPKYSPEQIDQFEALKKVYRVDVTHTLPAPPVALQVMSGDNYITLFTKGNFSILTGKAKSRKSFLASMFLASAINGEFESHFICPSKGMNLLFDTEQSSYKVNQIARRICKLSGNKNPDNFTAYTLRPASSSDRLAFIDYVISTTENLNFVVIDGIVDLDTDPILDAKQAEKIIQHLMQWSELYNIHIVCVLHYNKTANTLLGHLGSFAHRKADTVIEVVKDGNVSKVNPVDCREKEFEPFAFIVDEHGIPSITEMAPSEMQGKKLQSTSNGMITPSDYPDHRHKAVIQDIFEEQPKRTYGDFLQNIIFSVENHLKIKIGESKAKNFATYYRNNGFVSFTKEGKQTFYSIPNSDEIETNEMVVSEMVIDPETGEILEMNENATPNE